MRRPSRVLLRALTAAAVGAAGCSDGDPSGPSTDAWVLQVAGGDLQFAQAGQTLPEALRVSVRTPSGDVPSRSVTVRWDVLEGSGATLQSATTSTEVGSGITTNRLRVGSAPGRYRVRATAEGAVEAADFEAHAVVTPVLDAVPAGPVGPGEVITHVGSRFSPVPSHNLVLFDGVRGRVMSASADRLSVEVPRCLPSRVVQVGVALGSLRSDERSLEVATATPPAPVAVGESRDLEAAEGGACVRLPQGQYLAVSLSAGTVGGGLYGFTLRGLSGAPLPSAAFGGSPESTQPAAPSAQERWEGTVRALEGALRVEGAEGPTPEPRAEVVVPEEGDRRTFEVLNRAGKFEEVTGVVRYVGNSAVLYVDEAAPAQGLAQEDYAALSAEFDDMIHPVVTGAFGASSDLDGNEREIILFTPVVNRLTAPDDDGFVGGFFYGLDLLPEREHSNAGEIFYALVADPAGVHGRPIDRDRVMESLPAVLAHELQHMIHFNQRILVGGATTTGSLWISEGLAHMAEDVVAQHLGEREEPSRLFTDANDIRARRFLAAPSDASLLFAQGSGSLAERGGAWLFVRYLDEQVGRQVLLTLSQAGGTGVENVTAVAARSWDRLVADWLTTLYTDGIFPDRPALEYPVLDLRRRLTTFPGGYPLRLTTEGGGDFVHTDSLLSSSGDHVLLQVGSAGTAVDLASPSGAAPTSAAVFRLRIVRIR